MDKPNAFGYFYACPNSPQLSQFTPVDVKGIAMYFLSCCGT